MDPEDFAGIDTTMTPFNFALEQDHMGVFEFFKDEFSRLNRLADLYNPETLYIAAQRSNVDVMHEILSDRDIAEPLINKFKIDWERSVVAPYCDQAQEIGTIDSKLVVTMMGNMPEDMRSNCANKFMYAALEIVKPDSNAYETEDRPKAWSTIQFILNLPDIQLNRANLSLFVKVMTDILLDKKLLPSLNINWLDVIRPYCAQAAGIGMIDFQFAVTMMNKMYGNERNECANSFMNAAVKCVENSSNPNYAKDRTQAWLIIDILLSMKDPEPQIDPATIHSLGLVLINVRDELIPKPIEGVNKIVKNYKEKLEALKRAAGSGDPSYIRRVKRQKP